jgi:F420H(2)-dependent quinone reductase
MQLNKKSLERDFFRILNSVVEPAVRRGLFSPRIAPGGLMVLESKGFKSGQVRRTPLLCVRLGKYVFISTARGDRSFWVKNLKKSPQISYFLGGKQRSARAYVIAPGVGVEAGAELPPLVNRIFSGLNNYTEQGWAFALLKRETH